ncbi:MAG: ABC transporter substrate-binding protein [Fibrobacterales bacterium]
MKRCFLLVLLSLLSLFVMNCGKVKESDSKYPRSECLFIGGSQWGEATTFNPLSDWPAWPSNGQVNLVYESLLMFNMLTGEVEPLLAQSYSHEKNGISVILNPYAHWNDGKPVTAKDVKFSFEIGQRYKNVPVSHVWDYISEIDIEQLGLKRKNFDEPDKTFDAIVIDSLNPYKLTFVVNKSRNNPLIVMDILGGTNIIPEHIFGVMLTEASGDISVVKQNRLDNSPVGSGPYKIFEESPEKIVLIRDPNYWGNKVLYNGKLPAPKYIIHPIYKSNDHYSLALQQGNLDISETFIPRIWLKERKGVKAWFPEPPYFIAGSMPMFVPNVTRKPLDDIQFRRAMAFAINYADIRDLAVSGYSDSLSSGLILPFGNEARYFHKGDADSLGVRFDIGEAKKILAEAGYRSTFNSKGELEEMRGPDGSVIPTLYIQSPVGWSDWESIVRIAVKSMREAGIDIRQKFIDASLFYGDRPLGKFDVMLDNPAPDIIPSRPWSRFETVCGARDWRKEGERMSRNYGRYKNAMLDSILNVIPTLTDTIALKQSYRVLNQIVMKELPVLPVVYRPQMYYEYSTKHWSNFPNSSNPYAPPSQLVHAAGIKALWQIKSVKETK